MSDQKPKPKTNLAVVGLAVIGAGFGLAGAGLLLIDNVPLAAAGAGVMGVGFVYLLRGAWRLG